MKSTHRIGFLFATTVAITVCSAQSEAWAADAAAAPNAANTDLDEIVVTARRREENLQNVPVSITALSSTALERQNVVKLEDIQRVTPSFGYTASTRGESNPSFAIRGLRSNDPATNVDQPVTVYFDEVPQARPTGANQVMFDLQSIQILKGPQGTLFGRNTIGGAVLIETQKPTREFGGYVKAAIGSFDYRDVEGAINLPLGETLAVRIAAKHAQRDGYFINVLSGEDLADLNSTAGRLSIAWEPTSSFRSTFIGSYFRNDSNGYTLKIDHFDPRGASAALRPQLTAAVPREIALTQALGRYEFRSDINDFYSKDDVWSVQNKTEFDLTDRITIKNIIAYRRISSDFFIDNDSSALRLTYFPAEIRNKQFSEELQANIDLGALNVVTGLFYLNEKSSDYNCLRNAVEFAPPTQPASMCNTFTYWTTDNTSYAAFAHATLKLDSIAQGLSLAMGLRHTWDDRTLAPRVFSQSFVVATNTIVNTCAVTGLTMAAADPALCGSPVTRKFKEPTYEVTLSYQASMDAMVYLAHRRGYKAGGINSRPTPVSGVVPFGAEKLTDFEIGLKSQFDLGGLKGRFNVAAYDASLKGAQRSISFALPPALPGGPPRTSVAIINAAGAKIRGGEAELTVRPASFLDLSLAYAYIHTKYKNFVDRTVVNGVALTVDISDSRFGYTPTHQISGTIRVDVPLDEDIGALNLQLSGYYQSGVYFREINSANCAGGVYIQCLDNNTRLSPFATFNFRAEWSRPFRSNVDVALFVNNLTDEFHEKTGGSQQTTQGFRFTGPAAPRMYGVSVRAPF